MKPSLPTVLSLTAGYVDTAGFLALNGLFTAHVTGNFVMIGDALAHGSSGIASKLLALPVFAVAVLVLHYAALRAAATPASTLRAMLVAKFVFLVAAAVCAVRYGSIATPDSFPMIMTRMLLVAAMAIQNAAHRIHLASAPPSTLMTGSTTQIMLDVASLLYGKAPVKPEVVKPRLARVAVAVGAFAVGCGLAAPAFIFLGMWCFTVPPVLNLVGLALPSGVSKDD